MLISHMNIHGVMIRTYILGYNYTKIKQDDYGIPANKRLMKPYEVLYKVMVYIHLCYGGSGRGCGLLYHDAVYIVLYYSSLVITFLILECSLWGHQL